MARFIKPKGPAAAAPDPDAVAAFASGADSHEGQTSAPGSLLNDPAKNTEGYAFRMTLKQKQALDYVLANSNAKSIQKLIESILWPEIERRMKDLAE